MHRLLGTALALATTLAAQGSNATLDASSHPLAAGTYSLYGFGCLGTGSAGQVCAANNPGATSTTGGGNTNIFALEVTAPQNLTVTGFELLTLSRAGTILINTELYLADGTGARPATSPVRRGTMVVGTSAMFYATSFPALMIAAGQKLYLSFGDGRIDHPIDAAPAATLSTHFFRTPTSSTWSGPFLLLAWAFKVDCAGAGAPAIPVLGNSGLPTILASFDIGLARARPSSAALLLLGISDQRWGTLVLPVDLRPVGAPGCKVLASGDIQLAMPVDALGAAKVTFTIPNNPTLAGFVFFNQWIVLDQPANALGLVLTNGGKGTIG